MKAKSQPDVLQAWLATQDLPPLDRQYMKYAAANDNEVFKMVMGNHDWMVVTPSEAKSGWGKILNMRMVKTWSFAELCDSRIEPKNKALQEIPFQQNLTWRDGGQTLIMLAVMALVMWVWAITGTVELYVWMLGFYCWLCVQTTSAKYWLVRGQTTALKPWQTVWISLTQSLFFRGVLCWVMGYVFACWLFMPLLHQLEHTLWPNASMALAFAIYLLVASLDWFLNRRLDARLNSTEPAQHYELWLYHRDGSRTCYARANERASLELLQHWLKAQQQRYFDAHPAQLTHTQLTGRL
jgi:hypothetical protein